MRRWLAGLAGAALLLGAAAAQASEATQLADRAGFLLGHAYRCGAPRDRIERSQALVERLIAAFAADNGDRQDAQAQFAEQALAGALAQRDGGPLPPCRRVLSQLGAFERHEADAAGTRGEREMATDRQADPPAPAPRRSAAPKPERSARPAATKREELTPESRAALELRQTARPLRGRPPSI